MPSKKNDCPNCGQEIREGMHNGISNVHLAGRDLTATVECGNCGHQIVGSGTFTVQYDDTLMD